MRQYRRSADEESTDLCEPPTAADVENGNAASVGTQYFYWNFREDETRLQAFAPGGMVATRACDTIDSLLKRTQRFIPVIRIGV